MKIVDNLHVFEWTNPTANNCNTYLIDGEKPILVDPGHAHLFGHVKDGLSLLSLSPQDMDVVIITHGHPDHMEGTRIFSETSAMIAVHAGEMDFIRQVAPHYGQALGISDFEPDILLGEGDLRVGDVYLEIIHTPGHSPGSVCVYWPREQALFSGDVVFYQGIGRTDLPGGDGQALKRSIQSISQLDVEHLLPGHGPVVSGNTRVAENFKAIERDWFAFL